MLTTYWNACVSIRTREAGRNRPVRVLCDPWLTPGAFLGSWFHWPALDEKLVTQILEERWDAIYVSHLHPDHFDRKTLATLLKRNPDAVLIVPKLKNNWLSLAAVRLAGEGRVIELSAGSPYVVGDATSSNAISIEVIPLDICDPTRCQTMVPCHSNLEMHGIDSVALFAYEGFRVAVTNDALSDATLNYFASAIGSADVVLGLYSGASAYPQCYENLSESQMKEEVDRISTERCSALANFADKIGARVVVPYAGEYLLGGSLFALNKFTASWPKELAVEQISQSTSADVLNVLPGDKIAMASDDVNHVRHETDLRGSDCGETYLRQLKHRVFPYQRLSLPRRTDWIPELQGPLSKVVERFRPFRSGYSSSFVLCDQDGPIATLNLGENLGWSWGEDPWNQNVSHFTMDSRLFRAITVNRRPGYRGFTSAHWNQAELGSHMRARRVGSFEPMPHLMLNFLS